MRLSIKFRKCFVRSPDPFCTVSVENGSGERTKHLRNLIDPEIEAGKLNVESSDLSIKMARAGYLPTLNLSAGIGSTNANGSDFSFSEQVKQNWNNSLGLTLSIPIFDKRQTKSSINKAKLQKQTSQLDLLDLLSPVLF